MPYQMTHTEKQIEDVSFVLDRSTLKLTTELNTPSIYYA